MTLHLPHPIVCKSLLGLFRRSLFPSWTFSLLSWHSPNHSLKKLSHAKTKPKSCPSRLGRTAWNQNTNVSFTSWPPCLWERQSVSHWLDRMRFFGLLQHCHPNTMSVEQGRTRLMKAMEDSRIAEILITDVFSALPRFPENGAILNS